LIVYLAASNDGTPQKLLQDARESLLRGDEERALAQYRRASEIGSGWLDGPLGEAGILAARRRFTQAASILRASAPRAGDHPEAWRRLGHAFREARATDEAIQAFSRSLELEPGQAHVRIELGDLYHLQGRAEEAEACYRIAGAALPDDPDRLAGLGRLHASLGRSDSAAVCLESALLLRPADADLLCDYAEALTVRGNHENAIKALQRALAGDAFHLRSRYLIARALGAAGRMEASGRHVEAFRRHRALMDLIEQLEAQVAEDPTAEGYQALSHLYTRIKRDSLAAKRLMRATCLNPMVTAPQQMDGAIAH
jgi:tetratricopeptide (TPR) repeat protein